MGGFDIRLNFAFTYSSTLILKLFFILTHFILPHMDYYKRYMCLKNKFIKLLAQRSNSEVVTKFFSLYIPSLKKLKGKKKKKSLYSSLFVIYFPHNFETDATSF